ncbi:HAMP domain-containing protein [Pseudobacteriovorax antillogorgiicola]|uniref:Hpt domain-containing protein n=1 Tax=Pseudobacteriovorax antillogorgiicola TaxID=1513793 RepID=A0A1Y6BIM6_9BACT|nr:HAMP domain-containing protein [Pseudobacteriovorax antillogorgiicola]TCS55380.1 Hpt domain-containing protein [Pseudobacteriovorax antillogorgiicola]SMF13251.1 Hpt domain-containing protein [Pseudobacteriovorax antillogorgiicola]
MRTHSSIVFKLNLAMVGAVVLCFGVLTTLISYLTYQQAIQKLEDDGRSLMTIAELSLKDALWDMDTTGTTDLSKAVLQDKRILGVRVQDKTGSVEQAMVQDGWPQDFRFLEQMDHIILERPVVKDGEEIGLIKLVINRDIASNEFWRSVTTLIVGTILCLIFAATTIYVIGTIMIKRPISKLRSETNTIASGNLNSDIDQSRNDELGDLARDFSSMRDSIRQKIDIIHVQNEKLEETVELRTQQLREETEKIKTIFNTLEEGIFTLSTFDEINPNVSSSLYGILDLNDHTQWDLQTIIFAKTDMSREQISYARTVIESSIGEAEFTFEANEQLLPHRLELNYKGRTRTVDFSWRPLCVDGIVEALVVSVRDVSLFVEQDQKIKENMKQISILNELIQGQSDRMIDSLTKVETILSSYKKEQMSDERVRKDLAALHTVKGNARTFGFHTLSSHIHELEHHLGQKSDYSEVERKVDELKHVINDYRMWFQKLGHQGSAIPHEDLNSIRLLMMEDKHSEAVAKMDQLLVSQSPTHVGIVIRNFFEVSARQIAHDLGIKLPHISIEGDGGCVERELIQVIEDCMIHMLRNSMDHGIRKSGQDEGAIWVKIAETDRSFVISLSDSGRGISLDSVKSKAFGTSDLSQELTETILNDLIFKSGFSTADTVTEISGRGIGMDSVARTLRGAGGSIHVKFNGPVEDGHQKIEFLVEIPRSLRRSRSA